MRPFGIQGAGCWLRIKFLLEALSKALSLNGVRSATGVDAGATLGLGLVDLSGLQPDLELTVFFMISNFSVISSQLTLKWLFSLFHSLAEGVLVFF